MDLENSEAPDSARATIPAESIHKIGNGEPTPIEKTNPSEALITGTSIEDTPMQSDTMEAPSSPPLTHALEALLGGLDPPANLIASNVAINEPVMNGPPQSKALSIQPRFMKSSDQIEIPGLLSLNKDTEYNEPTSVAEEVLGEDNHPKPILTKEPKPDEATPTPNDEVMEDVQIEAAPLGDTPVSIDLDTANHPAPILPKDESKPDEATCTPNDEVMGGVQIEAAPLEDTPAPIKPDAANADETINTAAIENSGAADAPTDGGEEHPEWEVDSSPIESSSDDSSSDTSSSDESDDGDNTYKLLSPEEQARILMAGDGGSDDEGEKPKGSGGQLRTKNEVPDEVIPKPDVTITPDMKIAELGTVETIVQNILLIKAKTSGEYKVLESGSVLCLEDRSIIGVVAETLGRVQQPLYSVLFTNAEEITAAGLAIGIKIFYSEQHSTYVFTQALKAYKGSDASNLHDEEVGDEEMEFSDDEAEAEHKRRVKQKRMDKRGGKMQQNGGLGRGHPLQQHTPYDASNGISYDDADDDGPYKPLSRPAGYADSVGRSEAPQEGSYSGERPSNIQNRDQFRGRGRGDRGRGRGDRGRGRGGYQNQRGGSSGYSLPPQPQRNQTPSSSPGMFPPAPFQPQGRGFTLTSPPVVPPQNFFNMPSPQQYSPHQPQLAAWPQFHPPPFQQQPYSQSFQNGQNWPNMPPAAPSNGGAFINPAFFNNGQIPQPGQWNSQGQGRGRGTSGT